MKKLSFLSMIIVACVSFFSCNHGNEEFSDPIRFSLNINQVLGITEASRPSTFSQLFSLMGDEDPNYEIEIDGQKVSLAVTVSLVNTDTNEPIQTITQNADTVIVAFQFSPVS